MSLNCNYLQLDMLQLSEVTVGRSYSCLWLQLAEVTVVCGYSLQKLQLTFYTRFQNGPRALTWGQLFWSNATCRRIWTKYLPQWRCLTCPQCLWSSERGSSREQAVPAGSSHQKVSSTAQEGLDFGIVLCYRRLFVRYISLFVTLDRTKHFVFWYFAWRWCGAWRR